MAKIIKFPTYKAPPSPQAIKLKEVSDQLDQVIVSAMLEKDLDPHEVAGLMAHRLGSLIDRFEDKKAEVWVMCEQVLKRQAHL